MRDGVELAADVFLPAGTGPFPTVVLRTPYVRSRSINNPRAWVRLVDYGYALVTVDLRGRNDSDGKWRPWTRDDGDGHDVIEWAASQSWSSGNVGMVGGSYDGRTQWWTAASRPKHLKCIVPLCIGVAPRELPFGTGIPLQYWLWWMNLVLGKTQQFSGAPAWETSMNHLPLADLDRAFGLSRSTWKQFVAGEVESVSSGATLSAAEFEKIDIPVLIGVGWWDDQGAMLVWQQLQRAYSASQCRLLIGAWDHAGNLVPRPILGGLDVSASVMDTLAYIEQFLAWHLKGERTPIATAPRCRVFLTGENRWEELDHWPHPNGIETPMYLDSDGDARGLKGSGRLLNAVPTERCSDSFVYDPNNPGRDMSNLAVFAWSDPPLDQRYLQRRGDTLNYTSPVLAEPVKASGRFCLRAFVSSDRPDTDLYVSLSDVHPDGRAVGLAATNEPSACLRLRYRDGKEAKRLEPGRIYEVTVQGSWIHHVFAAGHRIRLTVSSGNFPLMARNAGTGKHWAEDEVLHAQTNTVHHSHLHPSHLLLPIVARGGG